MTQEEIKKYAFSKIGTPYNRSNNPDDHSLETGFKCFSWAAHLYQIAGKGDFSLYRSFDDLKTLRNRFRKVDKFEFLDIVLFSPSAFETKHIGVMLDGSLMSHCSSNTNGVAISNVHRSIFKNYLKGIYRLIEN